MTTIRVLVEERSLSADLEAEHGLSLLISAGGESWLFDTGGSGAAARNAERLGIDLAVIRGIVLSHGHHDHTGGLPAILAAAGPKTVYAHPDVFRRRFNLKKSRADRAVGFPDKKTAAETAGGSFDFNRGWRRLSERVHLSGEIPLVTDFDEGEKHLTVRRGVRHVPDTFIDEQFLLIESDDELIMVNGCCHSGLINSLKHLRFFRPKGKLRAVVGGLHLRSARLAAIGRIIFELTRFKPGIIAAGHCTGETAEAALSREFGDGFQRLQAGLVLEL